MKKNKKEVEFLDEDVNVENDGDCIGNYLSTDKECKKCIIQNECIERTNERKTKKTK